MNERNLKLDIYVAGSRHEVTTVRLMHDALRGLGHHINYDWTREENVDAGKPRTDWLEHEAEGRLIAQAELEAVETCDALMVCGWGSDKALGTFIEIGMALALGKPVAICGPIRNSIFWCFPNVLITEDVKDGIKGLEDIFTA